MSRFELDPEGGFTVTERIDADSDTRRQFDEALRLIDAGEQAKGIELLEQVVQAAPGATIAQVNLGIAYALTGDLEAARASLEAATELSPKHPVAHNELGIVYRKLGRFDAARRSYEAALDVYPDFHHARRNLAILCDVYLSDMNCARRQYEIYRALVPEDEAVEMWLADVQNRLGE